MSIKARVEDGFVVEVLSANPFPPFHPSLVWVDCAATTLVGYLFDGLNFFAPNPPPTTIPTQVTPLQARKALLAAGLLAQVQAEISACTSDVQLSWEYASIFERGSPLIATVAGSLNLTSAQIDALFISAATFT